MKMSIFPRVRLFSGRLLLGIALLSLPPLAHAQQSRHTADDGAAFDNFGGAVSISDDGQRALAGAYLDDVSGNADQGSAYVFTRDGGGSFQQEAKLVASDGAAGDSLAADDEAVSINADGTVALVGAFRDNVDGNANQGSAYVFTRDGSGSWSQAAKLTAESGAALDRFGSAVSISDDGQRALVGADFDDGSDGTTDQGAAYVFTRSSGGSWVQEARLSSTALAGKTFPNAGDAVALSGDGSRALIGARFDDLGGGDSNDGSAAVFSRDGSGNWTEEATLTASDAEADDFFGGAVSLSDDGKRALIGARLEDGDQATSDDQGAAYVFSCDESGNWTEEEKLTTDALTGDVPNFGNAVSLSGDGGRALIGAWLDDPSGVGDAGSAFVFDRVGGSWDEVRMITADDAAQFDNLGDDVSLNEDGQQAIVGVPLDDTQGATDPGSFYAFGSSSLPVELASFTARRDDEAALLQWRTLSETNNSGFEIQRQFGDEWEKIGFVESAAATGTATDAQRYTFRTEKLDYGRNTFRLVQVDLDGSETVVGPERTAEIGLASRYELSQVSPNPVQGQGTVEVAVRESQPITVALYDALGRQVRVLHDGRLAGNQTKHLSLPTSGLASGVYVLRMRGASFSAARKVVLAR